MTGMPEHAHRAATHRQPRDRRVDHTTPGFVRPPDPEPAYPLTPADPHPHAWADLGTPGLHGSVCRLCGETQID